METVAADIQARYQALLEVSESIASHRRLPVLFEVLRRSLRRLLEFDLLGLGLLDETHKTIRLHLVAAEGPIDAPVGRVFPVHETPGRIIIETGQPLYVPDAEAETRFPLVNEALRAQGVGSYCMLPLATAQRLVGGLNFGARRKNAYTPADLEFMQQVARPVAVAVDNALNFEAAAALQQELAVERDRLRLLLDVNNAVVKQLRTRELMATISACLRRALGVDYVSLALFDSDAGQLRLHVLDFPEGRGLLKEQMLLPPGETPAGKAFTTRMPVVVRGAEIEALPPEAARRLQGEGLRSVCCLPLTSGQQVLGTVNIASRDIGAFSDEDIRLLTQVAGQIAIALDNALAYRRIEELNARLAQEKLYLEDEIRTEFQFDEIVGRSEALRAVLRQAETVAPSDSTVLISGETGTGKEVVARAIHDLSSRRRSTFVKINCAAIPTGLLESELFGHEKGAFTGAIAQRIGRFELAHRGTLFLDEIGEIPLELQPKLLRVLQEQEFERLGSSRTIRVDVRLLAATNRDLRQMVSERQFRADLFYRLNVFPIQIPPLRERPEDIPLLIRHFAQQCARRMNKEIATIPSEAMEAMVRYPWPGNVRELQNLVERAVILSPGPVLKVPVAELKADSVRAPAGTLEETERQHILRVLRETDWVLAGRDGAAARLGMKRSTLQFRMKKLGITRPR